MAKIVLTDIVSGFNPATINSNFAQIASHLNTRALYRSNPPGEPNQMTNVLDMNGQRIINLPAPTSPTEPARLVDIGNVSQEAEDARQAAIQAKDARDQAVVASTSAINSATSAQSNASAAQSSAANAAGSVTLATQQANAAAQYAELAANNSRLGVGSVVTSAPGGPADATITGPAGYQLLNLTIPRGATGPKGDTGDTGPLGPSGDGTGDVIGQSPTTIDNLVVWKNVDGKYIGNSSIPVTDVEQVSRKGQPNGYVPLGADGLIPDEFLNIAPEVQPPVLISPVNLATGMTENPLLVAGGFFSSHGATHQSSQFQVGTFPSLATIVYDSGAISATTEQRVPVGILGENTNYSWRVRYQSSRGVWSPWSEIWTFTTMVTFNSYIPTPPPSPALGAAFRGGYYGGDIRHTILTSATSRSIVSSGEVIFTVNVNMDVTPIVYGGQVLRIKSTDGVSYITGTVTGARGTTLTINATSSNGSGSHSNWFIQAVHRLVVMPAAGRPTPLVGLTGIPTSRSLTNGWANTSDQLAASPSGIALAVRSINYNGYNDWYVPARDEILTALWTFKQNTLPNYMSPRGTGTYSGPALTGTQGDSADISGTTLPGEVRNSVTPKVPTSTIPGQTAITAFQLGGPEALPLSVWTSTYVNNTSVVNINNNRSVGGGVIAAFTAFSFDPTAAQNIVPFRREII